MTPEITVLVLAAALGLVHIVAQASSTILTRGIRFALGSRDDVPAPSVIGGRLERASRNFQETFPLFAAVVLAAVVAQKTSSTTAAAAWVYLVARALYLPIYVAGIPGMRTAAWMASFGAIVAVAVAAAG
jgi:uncharacterized MAPEG superfamily protein